MDEQCLVPYCDILLCIKPGNYLYYLIRLSWAGWAIILSITKCTVDLLQVFKRTTDLCFPVVSWRSSKCRKSWEDVIKICRLLLTGKIKYICHVFRPAWSKRHRLVTAE